MLVHDSDNLSIVILGTWNARIFSPQWLKKNGISTDESMTIEAGLDVPGLPLRFTFDNVVLNVSSLSLVLNVKEATPESIGRIQKIAVNILKLLPHTPIKAVGINFQFIESEPDYDNIKIFDLSDSGEMSDNGLKINRTSIKREILCDLGTLNFTISMDADSNILYNFNFHKETKDFETSCAVFDDDVLIFFEKSKQILSDVYKYNIEGVSL